MTPPLTEPLPWEVKAILWATLAVAVVTPFGRRDDWMGWTALFIVAATAVVVWGLLIRGAAYRASQWRRDRAPKEDKAPP